MIPAGRLDERVLRLAWLAPAAAVLVGLLLVYRVGRLPGLPATVETPAAAPRSWPLPELPPQEAWVVFRDAGDGAPATDSGQLAKRFRLAGTFCSYGAGENWRAILDDTLAGIQVIVAEGGVYKDVTVARILRDNVVLRSEGREERLWLSWRTAETAGADTAAETAADVPETAGAADRFGGLQVGARRWVFQRDALLEYYQELRDEPDRLLQAFDSLRPLYDDEQKITGYELAIEGEGDFFAAAGLREGDVVRQVNSMDMTNRRRAEYFIREFVADRANVFVLDIERGGEPVKLIYQTR